ncbi:MAG TPA: MBL fold metallo-hydrolase [Dehalococcoidia bacterium]|jgi:glyoxylase-like metal-dependent hydrolase (beta-lactamase superfamily II)|nr:MBL fold metallo-hydrolase [Dehalococcoidia bacterium]
MTDDTAQPAAITLGDNTIYAMPLAEGGLLLVDAGPDFEGAWEAAVRQAAGHGFAPADVRTVLVTHAHIDHAGLAHRWAEAGARILAGAADLPALTREGPRSESTRDARRDELLRHGCPEDVLMAMRTPRRVFEMRWSAPPPGAIQAAEDGATFTLDGGATLRVVAAPGHTPGNLVAFVEAQGDLYSGDTLLPGGIPTPGLHFPEGAENARWASLPRFTASVSQLRALEPRRVLPGHGEAVDNPERLFARFLRHQERRQRRIRTLLETQADSAFGLVRRLFRHLPDERVGQAMTETIGHLDALAERGEVTSEADADGVLVFSPVAEAAS